MCCNCNCKNEKKLETLHKLLNVISNLPHLRHEKTCSTNQSFLGKCTCFEDSDLIDNIEKLHDLRSEDYY